jgi:hypothetical protein
MLDHAGGKRIGEHVYAFALIEEAYGPQAAVEPEARFPVLLRILP